MTVFVLTVDAIVIKMTTKTKLGLIGLLLVGAASLFSGCVSASHISPAEDYQKNKAKIQRDYNQGAEKRTDKAREEYDASLNIKKSQESKKLSEDLRKNDKENVEEMEREIERTRNYDKETEKVTREIEGTYNPNEMITYSNKKPGNLEAGVYGFQRKSLESKEPMTLNGIGAEITYTNSNGLQLYGRWERDEKDENFANENGSLFLNSTGNTYGLGLGYRILNNKIFVIDAKAGVLWRNEKNDINGNINEKIIHESNSETTFGGTLGVNANLKLGKGWSIKAGIEGETYERGKHQNTTTSSSVSLGIGFGGGN